MSTPAGPHPSPAASAARAGFGPWRLHLPGGPVLRAALASGLFAGGAHAAPVLQVNASGDVVAASGAFNGCNAVSDFFFRNDSAAIDAGQALLDQVFQNGPLGSLICTRRPSTRSRKRLSASPADFSGERPCPTRPP